MTGPGDKPAARKAAFARRKSADPSVSDAARAHLLDFLGNAEGPVAGYWPIRTEIDPRPVMEALAGSRTLCLPVVDGPGLPLTFRRWQPGAAMEEGAFGAAVPARGDAVVPRSLIVPCLAFDDRGYRLGYGGGFYDRTLARLRKEGPVLAVAFAYEVQRAEELPIETADEPLDAIVTEAGLRRPPRQGGAAPVA